MRGRSGEKWNRSCRKVITSWPLMCTPLLLLSLLTLAPPLLFASSSTQSSRTTSMSPKETPDGGSWAFTSLDYIDRSLLQLGHLKPPEKRDTDTINDLKCTNSSCPIKRQEIPWPDPRPTLWSRTSLSSEPVGASFAQTSPPVQNRYQDEL